jgi:hypothetical protein
MSIKAIITDVIQQKKGGEKYWTHRISLPIKKIDGISVCASMVLRKYSAKYCWKLEIFSANLLNSDVGADGEDCIMFYKHTTDKDFSEKEIDKLSQEFTDIVLIIKKLKFNMLSGTLCDSPKEKSIDQEVYAMLFGDDTKHIEFSIDKCCVCYTETMTKTDCGHSLCWGCISKIDLEKDDADIPIIKCPMCRNEVYGISSN